MYKKETKTTGIEPYITECICMRLSEKESLSYLSDKGYSISRSELYRVKKDIQDNTHRRLNLIANEGFISQHLERLDMLKMIENELIENYKNETNPSKKANILMQIAELQQLLAAFYDSTQYVMQQSALIKKKRKEQIEQV